MVVTETNNHGYKKQDKGDDDWHIALNDTLDLLDVDVLLKDTSGNRPAAGTEGRAFLETDTQKLYYDNGSSWNLMLSLSYTDLTDTSDSITTSELDLSITPTWTGEHTFDSGIEIAEEQAIEDGSGTSRLALNSTNTRLNTEGGRSFIRAEGNNQLVIDTYSDLPLKVEDQEGNFTAVQYDTDPDAGVLRTPNAGLFIEEDGEPSSGSGVIGTWDGSSGIVGSYDYDNSNWEEFVAHGSPLKLISSNGTIDASQEPADLRIATGKAIEDESGTIRTQFNSTQTSLYSPDETRRVTVYDTEMRLSAYSGENIVFRDEEGVFDGVVYRSDTTTGTLELTNANLDHDNNTVTNKSLDSHYSETFPRTTLQDGETIEKDIPLKAGETLTVHRWGAHRTSDNTAPANLEIELLDDSDNSELSQSTVDNENTSGLTAISNGGSNISFCTIRIKNNTGSTEDVAGHFEVEVS